MQNRLFCSLDGINPSLQDDCIVLSDIRELPPQKSMRVATLGGKFGGRVMENRRLVLQVTLVFLIFTSDKARRAMAMDRLRAWCCGKMLRISTRPNQQLQVECTAYPHMQSTVGWTQPVSVTFSAWEIPYWQARQQVWRTQLNVQEGTVKIRPEGTAGVCPLSFRIWCAQGDNIGTVVISVNGKTICLTGMSVQNQTITGGMDEHGLYDIHLGDCSAIEYRTPESADELLLRCGLDNTVTFQADARINVEFSARGWYE